MGKRGNYTLIAAIGIVLAVLIGAAAVFTMVLQGRQAINSRFGEQPELVHSEFATDTLLNISVEGIWDVRVEPINGRGPYIELTAPASIISEVERRSGSRLRLGGDDSFFFSQEFTAVIYSDTVSGIDIDGASNLLFRNLDFPLLNIDVKGAAKIRGEDTSFSNLVIESDGASDIDLRNTPIVNAELQIHGASRVYLLMNGGVLKGKLDGVGKVFYSGEVSRRDFSVDGLGSIEYLESEQEN